MDIVSNYYTKLEFLNEEISMGTTIMAVCCKDGVIVGADSRTSSGPYIVNRVTDKITVLDDKIVCCRSGSAADTQYLADATRNHLRVLKTTIDKPNLVRSAANIFRRYCYNYRESLSAGLIVAGFDEVQGGQVYGVPTCGLVYEAPYIIGGSGSIFLFSYFDLHYRENMSVEECVKFVQDAITLAVTRDGSSGGVARISIIDKNGISKLEPLIVEYKNTV